ncbi:hypothetical protein F4780DRAFT_462454 [Xylariomycetidae sp. FL0641]|nr:hypothetical protein F4780DRAFT_462454 [Xylariomycetidae sp. FL0641]
MREGEVRTTDRPTNHTIDRRILYQLAVAADPPSCERRAEGLAWIEEFRTVPYRLVCKGKQGKVDSAVQGLSSSPPKEKAAGRRASSMTGCPSTKDMWENKTKLQVAKETQKTGWKINTSPMTIDDKDILKKHLVEPPVRAIDLVTSLGATIVARNRQGVTIKDAMDAIHKHNKKRADDELEKPYLEGFEWAPAHQEYPETEAGQKEKEQEWTRLYIHLSTTPGVSTGGGKKKKNKGGE